MTNDPRPGTTAKDVREAIENGNLDRAISALNDLSQSEVQTIVDGLNDLSQSDILSDGQPFSGANIDAPISEAGSTTYVQTDAPTDTIEGATWQKVIAGEYRGARWSNSGAAAGIFSVDTDGSSVIVGCIGNTSRTVTAFDPQTGSEEWSHNLNTDDANGVAIDGSVAASVHGDGSVILADANDYGSEIWSKGIHTDVGNDVAISDSAVVSVGKDKDVTASSKSDGSEIWNNTYSRSILSVSTDESTVVSGQEYGDVVASDISDGSELWSSSLVQSDVVSVTTDGSSVYASDYSTVTAADIADGSKKWETSTISGVTGIDTDGSVIVVSGSSNNNVAALDADSGKKLWEHTLHSDSVRDVATNGNYVFSGDLSEFTKTVDTGEVSQEFVADGSSWIPKI